MPDFTTVVALLAAALFLIGGAWILYEIKPMRLRSADGNAIPTAKDEDGIVAILELALNPANQTAATALAGARAAGRIQELPSGTRVKLIDRKFYKNGKLRQQLSIRTKAEDPEDKLLGSKVERVHVVNTEHAGLEVWVAGKNCKKNLLPF